MDFADHPESRSETRCSITEKRERKNALVLIELGSNLDRTSIELPLLDRIRQVGNALLVQFLGKEPHTHSRARTRGPGHSIPDGLRDVARVPSGICDRLQKWGGR